MCLPSDSHRHGHGRVSDWESRCVDGVENADDAMLATFGHERGVADVEVFDSRHAPKDTPLRLKPDAMY